MDIVNYKLIAQSFDTNKNNTIEANELSVSPELKSKLDQDGNGISVNELASALSHDMVHISNKTLKEGSRGSVPLLAEAEVLKVIKTNLGQALTQSMITPNGSNGDDTPKANVLKPAILAASVSGRVVDPNISTIANMALLNGQNDYNVLKNAAMTIVAISTSAELDPVLKETDRAIGDAAKSVEKAESTLSHSGLDMSTLQGKLENKATYHRNRANQFPLTIGVGGAIGAAAVMGVKVARHTSQSFWGAALGFGAGAAAGAIGGWIFHANQTGKAEKIEDMSKKVELYQANFAQQGVLDNAQKFYDIAGRATQIKTLTDAKSLNEDLTAIQDNMKHITEGAKEIIAAHKIAAE